MESTNIKILPVLTLKTLTIFPTHNAISEIAREKALNSINSAVKNSDGEIIVVLQKNSESDEEPKSEDLYNVGTLCKVSIQKKWSDNAIIIKLEALERFEVSKYINSEESIEAEGKVVKSYMGDAPEEIALMRQLRPSIEEVISKIKNAPRKLIEEFEHGFESGEVADFLATYMPLTVEKKQEILECLNVNQRLQLILAEVEKEKTINSLESKISKKIKEKIDESQKEYYLREKLRAIKEELGDIKNKEDDLSVLREKVKNNPYPEDVKKKILEEINRFEMTPQASSEANIIRTYIDWLVDVPWYQKTEDKSDLDFAEKVLNKNHYSLTKVKERIIEHLAVQKKTQKVQGQIICFMGPPGVGKTSLAKSIALAIGRNFVKASLGGVRDESEVRGHRRTYIGAMPGRIIQGMKRAKSINPVFLLDEIDKVSSDYKGDPSSALLEVLDPEQNKYFSDNYLEEPYDLSNVMFIATANYYENIPAPLLDRMEIINLSSYTELEKVEIANLHLIPKVLETHGLSKKQIKFSRAILMEIVRSYTKEAGVRQLERTLAKIARKCVVKFIKNTELTSITVDSKNIIEFLGQPIFDYTKRDRTSNIGTVTGLAWTQFGGDILPIEVTYFKGKGNLILTGKLGDIMKESANIALGFIKANAAKFNIDENLLSTIDIHLHVPEGAVPKDGPSAGITITTALISALTKQPVSPKIAMTGEITLRGNVLPIGGLKEKLISADRSKISKVLIPEENAKDLDEIPKEVKERLKIILVSKYNEVFAEIFGKDLKNLDVNIDLKKENNITATV